MALASTNKRSIESGVAAVEFALLLSLMLVIFGGILVYWNLLQVQQSVARATGDGARMLQKLSLGESNTFDPQQITGRVAIEQKVAMTVQQSLQGAGVAGTQALQVSITWSANQASLQVDLPYEGFGGFLLRSAQTSQLSSTSIVNLSFSS